MIIMKIIIFTCLAICLLMSLVLGQRTNIIQTDKGPVQGEIVKTVQDSSIEYTAFRGIPYAKPPIGELRFQPPVEADAWSETLLATKEAPLCPQINEETGIYDGDENCLFLNVYTPKISFDGNDNETLLAVMVWIYGGAFEFGTIKSEIYGPDYVIANRVVVVAMNYRLGALGFLSLMDIPEVTGNMGLKDQVLALKWVQKNIEKFGGDPNKVTIFGESAGSTAVLLHHLSPASKGLFRAAIAMSGAPLNPWGFTPVRATVEQAFEFGQLLGIDNRNKTELFSRLLNVSAKQLVLAISSKPKNEMNIQDKLNFPFFVPTYENLKIAKDVFMSECPLNKYKAEDYERIPVMLGFTNAEMLTFASPFGNFLTMTELSRNYLDRLELGNLSIVNDLNTIINNPKDNVKDVEDDVMYTTSRITSDLQFIVGIDATQKYLVKNSPAPVYYYRNSFDYEQSRHRQAGVNLDGCAHADDLAHIFWEPAKNQPLEPKSRIGVHRTRMARLWTNFAKYLDPTPDGPADPLLNFTWTPSGPQGFHLEIGNEKMTMEPRLITDTVKTVQQAANAFKHAECSSS